MPKSSLLSQTCVSCKDGVSRLRPGEIKELLQSVRGWTAKNGKMKKIFKFKNYYETTAFMNAAVWIAHREDHHPEITFGYKECEVSYSTHSVKGLTLNDFICAAKVDALLQEKD